MATLKQRLHRKNSSGTYDTIHLETGADCITGTLGIAHGGTGNTTGLAASATKLATARTIRTNLASTSTASFNGTANITPGITGTLGIANGGTGVTSISALKSALDIGEYNRFKLISTKSVTAEANGAFGDIVVNLNTEYAIRILIVSICNIYGYSTRFNPFSIYDEIKANNYFTRSNWNSFMCGIGLASSPSTELQQAFNCTGIGIIDNYTYKRVYYENGALDSTSSKNITLTTKFKAYADGEWSSNGPRLTLYKTSTITQKIYAEIIDV